MGTERQACTAILGLLRGAEDGELTAAELDQQLGTKFPQAVRQAAINKLSTESKLGIRQGEAGGLVYGLTDEKEATRVKGLNAEELLVYQLVCDADAAGIWTREIKTRTNLQQVQVTKILKALETRRLAKSIRPVSQPSKKYYMRYDLQPSAEVTGGAWYAGEAYDVEFIKQLRAAVLAIIHRNPHITLGRLMNYIETSELCKVKLADKELLCIVETLEADGSIERMDGEEGDEWRKTLHPIPKTTQFISLPCGTCPVFQECTPGGSISPATCQYFQEWLSF